MKQKTRKLSIRAKILLPASLLVIIICTLLGISSYRSINAGMVSMGVEEAEMVAKIAVNTIDKDLVSQLSPGCENTEEYQTLLASMRNVQENFGIAYMYTLYKEGISIFYGADTDQSELQASVGDPFERSYEEMKGTFEGEAHVQNFIDYSQYGDVISAYMPLMDDAGNVIAVVGCDYDASNVTAKLKSTLEQVIFMTIICVIAALLILSLIVNGITKSLRLVDQKIYDLVNNEGDLTQKLEITSGDEMELIAGNVNLLLEYIRSIMLNIAGNSRQLNSSSKNVVDNISSAEISITDVSATMEEMSAAMEETSASLNQIANSIGSMYETIGNISQNANDGKNSANEIMKKASDIYEKSIAEQDLAKIQAQNMASAVKKN